jgi:membrane protein DedA with SNARE-associated domain
MCIPLSVVIVSACWYFIGKHFGERLDRWFDRYLEEKRKHQ